jgi:hypothetical protein
MSCPFCGCDAVQSVFTPSGMALYCLNADCLQTFKPAAEAPSQAIQLASPPVTTARKQTKLVTSKQVLRDARAQLRILNVEIKRLETLKRERDEIKRLLAAAKSKPTHAVVRALRHTNQG